ncbi:cobalt-precorrin 5A hydrolase [Hydrogenoanaerobacterium sp.]|uniref:cobalt-precorrin 5A hydrolase n=1 Tax=Hydrogenoanaerobacterium sp. TaxID=2953763 RepID=UPI002899C896|nr:cobalt-precorrin 5A hydrolase [Hydrogenoanaerobacterium sp.]
MRISLISFTANGSTLCARLAEGLRAQGHSCKAYAMPRHAAGTGLVPVASTLGEWAKDAFATADGLVFVSAAGIAVRAIAPYVNDKTTDPAVIVIDEQGDFAVSLLSGHIGGANNLTLQVAAIAGAQPVISTATDRNNLFSVDSWAVQNNLTIANLSAAKRISAALLDGISIGFASDFAVEGALPAGVTPQASGKLGIVISLDENKRPFDCTLNLIPRIITAGIGCRRGIKQNAIEEHLRKVLWQHHISFFALRQVCSIALKANEQGLTGLCSAHKLPFVTFTAQQLAQVQGEFTPSQFVSSVTGVDNVCERAAVLGSGGELIVKKSGANGVTAALACEDWRIRF